MEIEQRSFSNVSILSFEQSPTTSSTLEFLPTRKEMSSFKLYYFDMMGRAETIRLIFAQAGIPYEDIRIQKEDWPSKYKPSGLMKLYKQFPVISFTRKLVISFTKNYTFTKKMI